MQINVKDKVTKNVNGFVAKSNYFISKVRHLIDGLWPFNYLPEKAKLAVALLLLIIPGSIFLYIALVLVFNLILK